MTPFPRRLAAVCRDDLPDLVVGGCCVGCTRPGRSLCVRCAGVLGVPAHRVQPDPCPAGLPPTWAVAAYDGVARQALLAHKERGRLGLARPLGAALGRSLLAVLAEEPRSDPARVPLAVPIPTSRAAVRDRGYDPLVQLARCATAAGRRRGARVRLAPLLRRTRAVADQSELGARARHENLAGAFGVPASLGGRLVGRDVVIVDDLITTGATVCEAARALTEAGATVLGAAALAATIRSALR